MYLKLFADACGALAGDPFCLGDGNGTPCPCGLSSPAFNREGCPNSRNARNGGRLDVIGTPSLTADSATLNAVRMPLSTSALFFQGTSRLNGGLGTVFGDGLRCIGGAITRIGVKNVVDGMAHLPEAGDASISVLGAVSSPGTRTYQVWYRNTASFCTPATFNLSNGWELAWLP